MAAAGLAGREVTGASAADAVAGALIGAILLVTSVMLLHNNRELLTGRGLPTTQIVRMRHVVGENPASSPSLTSSPSWWGRRA